RAVSAAIALRQAALQCDLQIAVGIKIGPAQVERSEQGEPATSGVIYSAALGQAAELQRAAAPGQIIVDRDAYLRTRAAFEYADVPITLRGRPQPTVGYLAIQAKPAIAKTRGVPGLSSELIGREFESAVLKSAVQQLTAGAGQALLLVGEAGIGKSRLVAEVRKRRPQHSLWLEGDCLEMTTPISFWPFQQALRGFFGWQTNDDETTRAHSIRTALERLAAAKLLNEETSAEIGAVMGKLASVRFGNPWDARLENLTPAELRQRTVAALRTLLTALARLQPLILTLEDLHWSDDASLDLLSELLSTVQGTPLLLLCVYRPHEERRCDQLPTLAARRCPGRYQELVLHELTPAQIQQMVESLLRVEALAPATKEWVLSRAQGNPYFTEELLLSLIEAGLIYRQEGVWRTTLRMADATEHIDLPYSIDHLILSRFDRLEASVRHILEAAAVLGRSFQLPMLTHIVAQADELDSAIHELEERGFLYCERRQPIAEFSFRHVLAQQAIYQILSDERRSNLHLRAAQAIEQLYRENLDAQVEVLAYHYVRSGDRSKAARYLIDSGAKARRTFANETAIIYFRQALDHLAQIGDVQDEWKSAAAKSEVWNQLGRSYHAAGRYQLAEEAFRQAIAHGETAQLPALAIVRQIHWLGEALYWQNKYTELRDSSLAGLALLPAETPSIEQILMLSHLDAAYFALGDIEASRAAARRVIPIIAQFPLIEELWPAYHTVIDYFKDKKEVEQALTWIEILRSKAAERQELMSLAKAVLLRGVTLSEQGDLHGAQPVLQEALAMSQTTGERSFQYHCLHRFAINALMLGERETACRHVDELLALMQTVEPAVPDQYAFCGHILLGAGQVKRGLALLTQTSADCHAAGASPTPAHGLWLGQALIAAGRHEEARQH
ncbi:MAG: AAA family ATPase, partial [Caldilinea sp.]